MEWQNPEQLRFVLTEGKKRQIRRMCEALGYRVLDLERVRIMNIKLGEVEENSYRALGGPELDKLLHLLFSK